MNHKRLGAAAAIIAVVIIVGFMLSVPHTRDVVHPSAMPSEVSAPPIVKVRDVFKKGTHTLVGTVEVPNACATSTADAALVNDASSTPEILITISVPKDTGICLQVPTTESFSTTISAPAHTLIKATVNDTEAVVTLL